MHCTSSLEFWLHCFWRHSILCFSVLCACVCVLNAVNTMFWNINVIPPLILETCWETAYKCVSNGVILWLILTLFSSCGCVGIVFSSFWRADVECARGLGWWFIAAVLLVFAFVMCYLAWIESIIYLLPIQFVQHGPHSHYVLLVEEILVYILWLMQQQGFL